MTTTHPLRRLDAIAALLGPAEGIHGEYCYGFDDFDTCDCGRPVLAALRTLGVTDAQIAAARRKRDLDFRAHMRRQAGRRA
jgi:hypothetical protein